MTSFKVDATGRSTSTVAYLGRAKKFKLPVPWIGHPKQLLDSVAFRSLSWPARRVLDFLEREHLAQGCAENGYLKAPYRQLANEGISARDIRASFEMLDRFGIVRPTGRPTRLERTPQTYALTWYPTIDNASPTEDYLKVTIEDVETFLSERAAARNSRAVRKGVRPPRVAA